MSLGELTVCEDFLDGHWEYAIDFLSKLDNIYQWHKTSGCPNDHGTCTLCELCSAEGLMGAAINALADYNGVEKRLTAVRASLGKRIPSRGAPGRETLFRNSLATSIFLSIVTMGDTRMQHATWQARPQSEVLSFAQSPPYNLGVTGSGDLDENSTGDALLRTYSGPKIVRPDNNSNLTAISTGSLSESTSSSSTFVVIRRCLASDCPCGGNKAVSNAYLRGASGPPALSMAPPSPTDPKKTRMSTKSEASSDFISWYAILNIRCRPRKTSCASEALARVKTNTENQKQCAHDDLNTPDVRGPETPCLSDAALGEQVSFSPMLEAESSSPSLECDTLIMDPRVLRLRAQITRSDDVRRALVEWCREYMAHLHLNPRAAHETRPETRELAVNGVDGSPSLRTVEHAKLSRVEADTKDQSHGDHAMTVQELQLGEQGELEARWLIARLERRKDRRRRLRVLDLR